MTRCLVLTVPIIVALGLAVRGDAQESSIITEFPLRWPDKKECGSGSTHEITYRKGDKALWVTNQILNHIARVTLDGKAQFFKMTPDKGIPGESGPHGIVFDKKGQLWVSLELAGLVVRVDEDGKIVEQIDVRLHAKGANEPINTSPHGIGLGSDGETIWFTGKKTNTVGKINPDRSVEHFELPTIGAVPIYVAAGPNGNVWCTELVGNHIARITPDGKVDEFKIPTPNSRPIAIIPGPDGESMWFSEEAGNKVARIDMNGKITEFPVPTAPKNAVLAGLAFDSEHNLWTQSNAQGNSSPEDRDYIIKIDKAINSADPDKLTQLPITYYPVPSRKTTMHRIIQGPDSNIWFTELGLDKLGKLTIGEPKP